MTSLIIPTREAGGGLMGNSLWQPTRWRKMLAPQAEQKGLSMSVISQMVRQKCSESCLFQWFPRNSLGWWSTDWRLMLKYVSYRFWKMTKAIYWFFKITTADRPLMLSLLIKYNSFCWESTISSVSSTKRTLRWGIWIFSVFGKPLNSIRLCG